MWHDRPLDIELDSLQANMPARETNTSTCFHFALPVIKSAEARHPLPTQVCFDKDQGQVATLVADCLWMGAQSATRNPKPNNSLHAAGDARRATKAWAQVLGFGCAACSAAVLHGLLCDLGHGCVSSRLIDGL